MAGPVSGIWGDQRGGKCSAPHGNGIDPRQCQEGCASLAVRWRGSHFQLARVLMLLEPSMDMLPLVAVTSKVKKVCPIY